MATPYKRRTILINKPFQIRFCIYVCLFLVALCFIYPIIVANLFDYFIRYAAIHPGGPDPSSLFETRRQVLMLLILTEIAFAVVTFLICIFISHRIAGPLHKLQKTFEAVRDGTWSGELQFRQKDYFPELAQDFNAMMQALGERTGHNKEALSGAISRIEAAAKSAGAEARSDLEPALATLRKLRDQGPSSSA